MKNQIDYHFTIEDSKIIKSSLIDQINHFLKNEHVSTRDNVKELLKKVEMIEADSANFKQEIFELLSSYSYLDNIHKNNKFPGILKNYEQETRIIKENLQLEPTDKYAEIIIKHVENFGGINILSISQEDKKWPNFVKVNKRTITIDLSFLEKIPFEISVIKIDYNKNIYHLEFVKPFLPFINNQLTIWIFFKNLPNYLDLGWNLFQNFVVPENEAITKISFPNFKKLFKTEDLGEKVEIEDGRKRVAWILTFQMLNKLNFSSSYTELKPEISRKERVKKLETFCLKEIRKNSNRIEEEINEEKEAASKIIILSNQINRIRKKRGVFSFEEGKIESLENIFKECFNLFNDRFEKVKEELRSVNFLDLRGIFDNGKDEVFEEEKFKKNLDKIITRISTLNKSLGQIMGDELSSNHPYQRTVLVINQINSKITEIDNFYDQQNLTEGKSVFSDEIVRNLKWSLITIENLKQIDKTLWEVEKLFNSFNEEIREKTQIEYNDITKFGKEHGDKINQLRYLSIWLFCKDSMESNFEIIKKSLIENIRSVKESRYIDWLTANLKELENCSTENCWKLFRILTGYEYSEIYNFDKYPAILESNYQQEIKEANEILKKYKDHHKLDENVDKIAEIIHCIEENRLANILSINTSDTLPSFSRLENGILTVDLSFLNLFPIQFSVIKIEFKSEIKSLNFVQPFIPFFGNQVSIWLSFSHSFWQGEFVLFQKFEIIEESLGIKQIIFPVFEEIKKDNRESTIQEETETLKLLVGKLTNQLSFSSLFVQGKREVVDRELMLREQSNKSLEWEDYLKVCKEEGQKESIQLLEELPFFDEIN